MRLSSVSRPGVPTTINGLFTLRASACNIIVDLYHPEQIMRSNRPHDELIQCKGSCQECNIHVHDTFDPCAATGLYKLCQELYL